MKASLECPIQRLPQLDSGKLVVLAKSALYADDDGLNPGLKHTPNYFNLLFIDLKAPSDVSFCIYNALLLIKIKGPLIWYATREGFYQTEYNQRQVRASRVQIGEKTGPE